VMVLSLLLKGLPPLLGLVFPLLLAGVQVRRLHDCDRSGWWALAAALVPSVPALVAYFATRSEEAALAAGSIVEFGAILWIGAAPGTFGDNRFGPAPPFTVRRVLTGR
jgi:uncharacterized membrane protein YhaH (DUF805 family)